MKTIFSFLLAFLALNGLSQSNVIVADVRDYGLLPQATTVTLTLLSPNPRTYNGVLVSQQPVRLTTAANGIGYFTNILWGSYRVDIGGNPVTKFQAYIQTNTTGTVYLSSLVTSPATQAPNPATNYYTMPQVDAIVAGATNGIVGGSGTTYTFWNTNLAAGVIATNGAIVGVGTNTTGLGDISATSSNNIVAQIAAGDAATSNGIVTVRPVQIPITFDNDYGLDLDNELAVAVLYHYHNQGQANLLGTFPCFGSATNINAQGDTTATIIDKFNTYYGFDIAVGNSTFAAAGAPNYMDFSGLASHYTSPNDIPSNLIMYRRILSGAKRDGTKVILCFAGNVQNLHDLYHSPADSLSPLTGSQLISNAVMEIVIHDGVFAGNPTNNLDNGKFWYLSGFTNLDILTTNFGVPITFVGGEVGDSVTDITLAAFESGSPFNQAWLGYSEPESSSLRDPITALYSVVGTNLGYFTYTYGSFIPGNATISGTWTNDGGTQRRIDLVVAKTTEIKALIEGAYNTQNRKKPQSIYSQMTNAVRFGEITGNLSATNITGYLTSSQLSPTNVFDNSVLTFNSGTNLWRVVTGVYDEGGNISASGASYQLNDSNPALSLDWDTKTMVGAWSVGSISGNAAGLTNLDLSTATGTLPLESIPSGTVTGFVSGGVLNQYAYFQDASQTDTTAPYIKWKLGSYLFRNYNPESVGTFDYMQYPDGSYMMTNNTLLNLSASEITSGTVPSARLTGTSMTNGMLVNMTNTGTAVFNTNAESIVASVVNGLIRIGDGTASAPSLSFANSASTGFYSGASRVGFQSAGTSVALFGATFLHLNSAGSIGWSAGTPTNTKDTGFDRQSAGIVRVLTNMNVIGTLTATNGVFGAIGCLTVPAGIIVTNNATSAAATNNVVGWGYTNVFGSIVCATNAAGQVGLSNNIAGKFSISFGSSILLGDNSQNGTLFVATNNVTIMHTSMNLESGVVGTTYETEFKELVVDLVPCHITLRMTNSATTVFMRNAVLNVKGAN